MNDSYQELKQQMRCRRRRVIVNNDGGDLIKAGDAGTDDPLDFVNVRTTPLLGTHVDTIFYSTHGGHGVCNHKTEVGQVSDHPGVAALIARRTDPLDVMTTYGHEHGLEVFWSMRMNDTHDGSRPERFAANRFKNENPECLLGTPDARPKHGEWSAVDYACEKVRALALALVEEVCRNYDVEGIELDFFRHPVLFKTTAAGLPVTENERRVMTDLLRNIAAAVEREGRKRGRPFLIAARTPDDPDYAATMGLDIEGWMREGLIDLYVPSGYFRLRSWADNVGLGHRHGVLVYPGLSETRVGGGHHADRLRASDECYRARSANAWQAGADGIYLFNLFDPRRRIWHEIGEPQALKNMDKLYFASVRGAGRVAGGAFPHKPFIRIPTLNPGAPLALPPGALQTVQIEMAENGLGLQGAKLPAITLQVRIGDGEATATDIPEQELTVMFNGRCLAEASPSNGWREFVINSRIPRAGWNTAAIQYRGSQPNLQLEDVLVRVDYSGDFLSDTAYLERTRARM